MSRVYRELKVYKEPKVSVSRVFKVYRELKGFKVHKVLASKVFRVYKVYKVKRALRELRV